VVVNNLVVEPQESGSCQVEKEQDENDPEQ
jgi:hypothetical protein